MTRCEVRPVNPASAREGCPPSPRLDVYPPAPDNGGMEVKREPTDLRFNLADLRARTTSGVTRGLAPIRVALDAAAVSAGTLIAGVLRFGFDFLEVQESSPLTVSSHLLAGALWLVALLIAIASNRLFDEDTLFPGGGESSRVLRSVIEAGAALSLFVFLTQSFYVSRSWFGLTLIFSLLGLVAERRGVRRYLRFKRSKGQLRRPSFLVSSQGEEWAEWRDIRNEEFEVVAELDAAGVESLALAVLADPLLQRQLAGSALVLKARDFNSDQFWQLVLRAGQLGWTVFVHSPVRSVGRDRLSVREVAGNTIVKVAPPALTGYRAAQKRALDVSLSCLASVLLAPAALIVAVMVVVGSGRPVFYRQERVGANGRTFVMWKFRTMRKDAEAETGPVWTVDGDDRRTSVGAVLRRTSLDELPQIWNVIKGDMSLVGPRPERPTFVDEFSAEFPWYQFRHRIRPGITGWAQSQGLRGNTALDSRIDSDNWYIENWSLWLDLRILLVTLRELLRGRNAY